MLRTGVVTSAREGKFVVYKLADHAVLDLLSSLRTITERNSAVVRNWSVTISTTSTLWSQLRAKSCNSSGAQLVHNYFTTSTLWSRYAQRAVQRLRGGEVMVLDVRPKDEFGLGHLPGAVNIPLREIKARLSKLKRSQEIIAYCRGPYCVLSYEAVAALRRLGFKARRLEDGLPEWRAAGLPVVTGT